MFDRIGPLNPVIHRIRVVSVIEFSVCSLWVTNFLILLQYNIRPPDLNCNLCALEFVAGVNLRRHDTKPDLNCDVCALKFVTRVNLRRHDTLPDPNLDVFAPEFAPGVNLRRHDTLT